MSTYSWICEETGELIEKMLERHDKHPRFIERDGKKYERSFAAEQDYLRNRIFV